MISTCAPVAAISSRVRLASSSEWKKLTMTCAPRAASFCAITLPMPLAPPVTSAILPCRSCIGVLLLLSIACGAIGASADGVDRISLAGRLLCDIDRGVHEVGDLAQGAVIA